MSKQENFRDSIYSFTREFYADRKELILFIISILIAAVISVFLLDFFLDLTERLEKDQLANLDERVTGWVFSHRSDGLTPVVIAVTHMGDRWAYILLVPLIAGLLYLRGHHWRLTIQGLVVLLSASLLNIWIKNMISRPRPLEDLRLVDVHSYSFPSGHSMSAIAFYGFLVYLTFKLVRNPFWRYTLMVLEIALILGIGLSRVYLGVHYPSDVLAGFAAGLFWLLVCIAIFRAIHFYSKKSDPLEEN